jgi:hypothetical protein
LQLANGAALPISNKVYLVALQPGRTEANVIADFATSVATVFGGDLRIYATGMIGDGTDTEGVFSESNTSTDNSFVGLQMYYVAINSDNPSTASQMGMWTAESDPDWVFPDVDATPPGNYRLTGLEEANHSVVGSLVAATPGNPWGYDTAAQLSPVSSPGGLTTNFWIASASGSWQDAGNWSAGSPALSQSLLLITNSNSKTITIDATTSGSFPSTLTISNLTISGPVGFTNTLSVISTNATLAVVGGCNIDSGGLLSVNSGTVTVGGPALNINGAVVLAGGNLVATNVVVGVNGCSATGVVSVAGGNLLVTNAAGNAVLDVRSGFVTLNSGLLGVNRLVITNACGRFNHVGGTLQYDVLVLDPYLSATGDGLPNWWKQRYGFDPLSSSGNNGPNGDPDFDGYTNLQEYQRGTSPIDASPWPTIGGTWTGKVAFVSEQTGYGNGPFALHLVNQSGNLFRGFAVSGGASTNPVTGYLLASKYVKTAFDIAVSISGTNNFPGYVVTGLLRTNTQTIARWAISIPGCVTCELDDVSGTATLYRSSPLP